MAALRLLCVPLGLVIIAFAVLSAIRTFVLPRAGLTLVSRIVLRLTMWAGRAIVTPLRGSARQAALNAAVPLALVLIVVAFLGLIWLGNLLVFIGLGNSFRQAYTDSGSSLSVLGFANVRTDLAWVTTAISEALTGTLTIALLIGFLPTIYGVYAQREGTIAALEAEVGQSDSAVAILERFAGESERSRLDHLWNEWIRWFALLGDTHSSLAGVLFVHSPQPHRSWVTTAAGVLDAAALANAALDRPRDPQADRCIDAGSRALRQILDAIRIAPDGDPRADATDIHVSRDEFDAACDALAQAGTSVKEDRDAAWDGFVRRRRRYEAPLLTLCRLTLPPTAPWSSDRAAAQTPLLPPVGSASPAPRQAFPPSDESRG